MEIYIDATALIALGDVGHLALLENVDGRCVVPETVAAEVTTQPTRTRVETLTDSDSGPPTARLQTTIDIPQNNLDAATDVLGESTTNGDTEIVASVLWMRDRGDPVAVISDDRRVRTVANEFGAIVTGTIGVVVRAVREGLAADEAKAIVREIDSQGLHLTGELRETALELIDGAAADSHD